MMFELSLPALLLQQVHTSAECLLLPLRTHRTANRVLSATRLAAKRRKPSAELETASGSQTRKIWRSP